jgi:hypothetical protein
MGKETVDCRTKFEPDAISERAQILVGRVFHEGMVGLPQDMANLFPPEEKERTVNLSALLPDSHKTPGTGPTKKVGQDGFDPVIFLMAYEENGRGCSVKVGAEKCLPLLAQDRLGDVWPPLLGGRRFSHQETSVAPIGQTCDKVLVPGIFLRIGVVVEIKDIEGLVGGAVAEEEGQEKDRVPPSGNGDSPPGSAGRHEVVPEKKVPERRIKGGERILRRRRHGDTSGRIRCRKRSGP